MSIKEPCSCICCKPYGPTAMLGSHTKDQKENLERLEKLSKMLLTDPQEVVKLRTELERYKKALEKAIEQRNYYLEIVADHEPFKKDLAELDKQITEILEGE